MRQTSEVLVPREDLPIRGTEETVGIEEKAQLREGSDEDLRWSFRTEEILPFKVWVW